MKRLGLSIVVLLALVGNALALSQSSVPPQFTIPWGNGAGASFITYPTPTLSQIGITNCRASLTDGFPPLTFTPSSSGGCPPFGADFNGILKWVTLWEQWQGAGATVGYSGTLSTAIGGYPKNSIVASAANVGCYWVSTVDNNASNPDTGGSNWTSACPGGGVSNVASTGSANSQNITVTPFLLRAGAQITYLSGFTNTSSLQINVNGSGLKNVFKWTCSGLTAFQGQETQINQYVTLTYDGTQWQYQIGSAQAFLNVQDQVVCGGATITDLQIIPSGSPLSLTPDCGARVQQWFSNTAAVTIVAPVASSNCIVQMENGAGAVIPTFSGFQVSTSTGDPLDNTNGSIFLLQFVRIHNQPTYIVKKIK